MESKTLAQRLSDDFRGGKSASEFMQEYRALTPEDREWFKQQYSKEGKPCVEKANVKAD